MPEESQRTAAAPKRDTAAQDLLLPVVPGVITSLALEGVSELPGTVKIAVAATLAFGLWGVNRRRSVQPAATAEATLSEPTPTAVAPVPGGTAVGAYARRHWRWLLLGIAAVAVIALVVTRLVFDRPTIATAVIALAGLAVTVGLAYGGRRLPGAMAASIAGGLLGLCLGIAFL